MFEICSSQQTSQTGSPATRPGSHRGSASFQLQSSGCDYSSWQRRTMHGHLESSDHPHATIIANYSPELKRRVTQMTIQCFGENSKPRQYLTTKPALIRCTKCSASMKDLSVCRRQHAKLHIMDVEVEQFGCSEPGCGYNTWWRHSINKHIKQHTNATIIDHQGPDLHQRVAHMVIECFGARDQQTLKPSPEVVIGKNREPKHMSRTGHSRSSKSLVPKCCTARASDSNTQPMNNDIKMTHPDESISIASSFVPPSHGALVEEETSYETCERIHRKMDALRQRLKRLKNLVGKK